MDNVRFLKASRIKKGGMYVFCADPLVLLHVQAGKRGQVPFMGFRPNPLEGYKSEELYDIKLVYPESTTEEIPIQDLIDWLEEYEFAPMLMYSAGTGELPPDEDFEAFGVRLAEEAKHPIE